MVEWSDESFRLRVAERARELGLRVSELLEKAGVSRDVFYKTPGTARRLDTILKIGTACGWSLADVMGFDQRLSIPDMEKAYASARRVMAALPAAVRTDALLVEAMCILYEEIRASGPAWTETPLTSLENILARSMGQRVTAAPESDNRRRRSILPAPETE